MTSAQIWLAVLGGLLTILAGLLVAIETAVQSLSKSRATALVDDERNGAERLLLIAEDPAPSVNSVRFLRTVVEVMASVVLVVLCVQVLPALWLQLVVAGIGLVLISFLVWGVAPRTLGRQHAEAVALATGGLVSAVTTVFGGFVSLLILVGNALTPGRGYVDGPFSSEAELRELVDIAEANELIEAGSSKMIHSVFDLGNTMVREVMVPRTDMVYIEHHKNLRQAVSLALRSGFSRIPVIGDDGLDDVIGVLYLKDLIKRVYDDASSQTTLKVSKMMREAAFCPDSKPVDELLREMQLTHSHLVVVIDEFGGTAGLATIEDILEEIVGEIVDEYDAEIPPVTDLGDGRFRVSSRLSVDEMGDLFGLKLDDDDVDSLGGLMAKELNKVPIHGSILHWEGLELIAERGANRRHQIATILVSQIPTDIDGPHDPSQDDPGAQAATELAAEAGRGRR